MKKQLPISVKEPVAAAAGQMNFLERMMAKPVKIKTSFLFYTLLCRPLPKGATHTLMKASRQLLTDTQFPVLEPPCDIVVRVTCTLMCKASGVEGLAEVLVFFHVVSAPLPLQHLKSL